MKSTPWDYVWTGLWITAIAAISLGLVWLVVPLTLRALGAYHVLFDLLLLALAYGLLSALVVRSLVRWRPVAAGAHDMDSPVFAYWKLLTVLYRLGQGALRPLVPFFLSPLLDALFGARIGRDVAFGGVIDDPYAVCIGNGVVLGHNSLVTANYLWDGKLTCGSISIGDEVTIGANSIVFPGVDIGRGAKVMNAAVVMPGTVIPAGETWRGNPARKWMPASPATRVSED